MNTTNINWYPGHMTKARRMMQEDIKLIDLLIELLDARVPMSSRNPDIDRLGQNKARLILLNKADLADERRTQEWTDYFVGRGFHVLPIDSRKNTGLGRVQAVIQEACQARIERNRRRGILNRPVRAMVTGIPNVGKSTFINSLAGRSCARTGNRPGVTKGKQWIRLNRQVELLDTPGILWPRFEDRQVGLHLAMTGAIRDEIMNREELALELIRHLCASYPGVLADKYGIGEDSPPYECLQSLAAARGCLAGGGVPDTQRAANLLLDDFRGGKIGRITLESVKSESVKENQTDEHKRA